MASALAPVGTKLPGCVIQRVDKRSLYLTTTRPDGPTVAIRKNHVTTKLSCDNLKSRFTVGQTIDCRVIDHDLLENVAVATMKKQLMRLPFLSINEVKPGDKLTAVVNRFTKTGVVVRVEERFTGLIPYLHLADAPLKRPQEKFAAGDKVDCRALVVDTAQNKLLLTAKRALVEARHPLLGCSDMLELLDGPQSKDQLFTAFVVNVNERGLLLSGVGDTRAWLPRNETGLSPDDVPEATFFRGQVLRFRIVRKLNAVAESPTARCTKYLASLRLVPSETSSGKRSKLTLDSVSIGQVFSAKVSSVRASGLIVDLYAHPTSTTTTTQTTPSSAGSAFLGFDHLSDSDVLSAQLSHSVKRLKPGSVLDFDRDGGTREVVVVNRTPNATSAASVSIIVSAKPTLIRAARNQHAESAESIQQSEGSYADQSTGFVRDFTDLRIGSQWFAWVLNHVDYGIFVQFPAGIRGLAPIRLLTDSRIPKNVSLVDLFPPGATVVAKVVELAPSEKRRCLVSLRMMDTYFAEEHYVDQAIRALNSWLFELRWISHRHESLAAFRIGDLVDFHAQDSNSQQIFGQASKVSLVASEKPVVRVPAVVHGGNNCDPPCNTGQTVTGVVSFVDLVESRLEVVLTAWIVRAVQTRSSNPAAVPRLGQQIRSVAVAVRPRLMAVVAFRGHAAGYFGVVPSRRAFNDVVGGNSWAIGQRNQVTLRDTFDQEGKRSTLFLSTLTIYDPVSAALSGRILTNPTGVASAYAADAAVSMLKPGSELFGLRFNRLVGQIAFFHLPTSHHPNQLVFARLINVAPNAKAIRAFQNQPPSPGTAMESKAVVLASAAEDKRPGDFHSQLCEVSFLDKPHVDLGDLVCAQLTRMQQDRWSVNLPGGAKGYLHVTGMLHSKLPQPLSLQPGVGGHCQVRLGGAGGLKKNRFVTCRIVDQVKHEVHKESGSAGSCFFVCTRPDVIRGGLKCWEARKPTLAVQTEGFVKLRSPDGLVLSLTHTDDLLVPFSSEVQDRIRTAQLRFRVGDHLCVRPLRRISGQLIGELVFAHSPDSSAVPQPMMSDDSLEQATDRLLQVVQVKTEKRRNRARLRSSTGPGTLHFVHKPDGGAADEQAPRVGQKRPPSAESVIAVPSKLRRRTLSSGDSYERKQPASSTVRCADDWDIGDPAVIQRYAAFMVTSEPTESAACADVSSPSPREPTNGSETTTPQTLVTTQTDKTASAEWNLMQTEMRKAMLAALVREQQTLPKGSMKPASQEEFELAVRNAPSNAACWTAYMTFVLSGMTEANLAEARAIAERGLRAISASAGLDPTEADLQRARLLSFYLVMEAKALQRCSSARQGLELSSRATLDESDPILALNAQAERLSDVLSRLVDLDQVPYTRRAIETLADIGQFERAEDLAKRLIKAAPTDADRWLSLIKVRFRAGRVAAAREAQRNGTAIVRPVHLPRFLTSCARLEFEFGDVDRAISTLHEQLGAHPKQRLIYEEFIKLLLLAGKRKEAESIRAKAQATLKPAECQSLDSLFNRTPN